MADADPTAGLSPTETAALIARAGAMATGQTVTPTATPVSSPPLAEQFSPEAAYTYAMTGQPVQAQIPSGGPIGSILQALKLRASVRPMSAIEMAIGGQMRDQMQKAEMARKLSEIQSISQNIAQPFGGQAGQTALGVVDPSMAKQQVFPAGQAGLGEMQAKSQELTAQSQANQIKALQTENQLQARQNQLNQTLNDIAMAGVSGQLKTSEQLRQLDEAKYQLDEAKKASEKSGIGAFLKELSDSNAKLDAEISKLDPSDPETEKPRQFLMSQLQNNIQMYQQGMALLLNPGAPDAQARLKRLTDLVSSMKAPTYGGAAGEAADPAPKGIFSGAMGGGGLAGPSPDIPPPTGGAASTPRM